MAPEFYHDFGNPEVERLARAICEAFGQYPDALVPESGYANSRAIPRWWKYQSDALKFIAMNKAVALHPTPRGGE